MHFLRTEKCQLALLQRITELYEAHHMILMNRAFYKEVIQCNINPTDRVLEHYLTASGLDRCKGGEGHQLTAFLLSIV